MTNDAWPKLVLEEWQQTYDTLHMCSQIVGKIRLAQTALVNHWWNTPLYVSPLGLTTTAIPHGERLFEIEFDFQDHKLRILTSDGTEKAFDLRPQSVSAFYQELMSTLRGLGLNVKIWPMPVEIPNPIRFDQDQVHASYDPEYATRFWHALIRIDDVFKKFRARFVGKVSPVHFWWGSFDHAVTRFSGRTAPPRAGADRITQEAYSHECISHGFWPGGNGIQASFYAYAAPEPDGFSSAPVSTGFYSNDLKEFLLPYDAVRNSRSPETTLMDFLQSTYEAGANLAKWDRKALER